MKNAFVFQRRLHSVLLMSLVFSTSSCEGLGQKYQELKMRAESVCHPKVKEPGPGWQQLPAIVNVGIGPDVLRELEKSEEALTLLVEKAVLPEAQASGRFATLSGAHAEPTVGAAVRFEVTLLGIDVREKTRFFESGERSDELESREIVCSLAVDVFRSDDSERPLGLSAIGEASKTISSVLRSGEVSIGIHTDHGATAVGAADIAQVVGWAMRSALWDMIRDIDELSVSESELELVRDGGGSSTHSRAVRRSDASRGEDGNAS